MRLALLSLALVEAFVGAGCAAMAETEAPGQAAPPVQTPPALSVKPVWLTPEKEAALVEVQRILREASQVAQSVVIKNPESKDGKFLVNNKRLVLSGIEGAQARAGDIEGARLTATANGVGKSWAIGIALAKAGHPYEALKAVDTRNLRPQALEVILEALHKSGDGRTALEVIENVNSPWDRAETLFLYARFLAQSGDPSANDIAQRAYAFSSTLAKGQPWVYARLGEFHTVAGDSLASRQSFQKAHDVALAVSDPVQRLRSLMMVVKTQSRSMDQADREKTYSEVVRIAKSLPLMQQESELGRIAREQLEIGQRSAAAETVRLILQVPSGSSPREQAEGLMRQVRWHLTLGDQEAAQAVLKTVAPQVKALAESYLTAKLEKEDSYYHSPELGKSIIYSSLAQLAAECGWYEMAQEAVQAITSEPTKAGAIRHIVTGLIPKSDRSEVQQVVKRLVKDATNLIGRISFPRDITLREVAVIQAAAGDVPAAVRTADRVVEALRAYGYREIVGILIRRNDWSGAQEVLSRMKAQWMLDESSHHTFRALGQAQAKAGVGKQVIEWSQTQRDAVARANVLLGVAEGLMDNAGIEPLLPVGRPYITNY
jgi:hypothetical protein